jgi:hypothetical protein
MTFHKIGKLPEEVIIMFTIEKLNNHIDPSGGWKNSFFGTLHAQGKHAVDFLPNPRWWSNVG